MNDLEAFKVRIIPRLSAQLRLSDGSKSIPAREFRGLDVLVAI
jgi:hypothetical protein